MTLHARVRPFDSDLVLDSLPKRAKGSFPLDCEGNESASSGRRGYGTIAAHRAESRCGTRLFGGRGDCISPGGGS
jgi:hypothetical protein